MPLHDWTLVTDNVFHHFHTDWLVQLSRAMNGGLLPSGYIARTEEYVGPYQVDVLALETGGSAQGSAPAQAVPPEPTATIAPPQLETWRKRRIAVYSSRDERRVAVLEIVSTGNKDSRKRAVQFQEKLLECLAAGLHLLLIDLLPATPSASGIAAAIATQLGSNCIPLEGRCATSFEVRPSPPTVNVYHQSLALERRLPAAPLFLEPGRHVEVPLEQAYVEALSGLPAVDRELLEKTGR